MNRSVGKIIPIILIAGSLSACATVVRGTTEDVVINYTPADANVSTSLNHSCNTSPCTVNVKRKDVFTVTASKPGFQTQSVEVNRKLSKRGAAGIAGNVVAGGLIGVGVDAASGATLDHYPNPVIIDLLPNGQAAPEPAVPGTPEANTTPTS